VYAFRSSHGPVDLAFTDRHGGVSAVPYAELNLALDTDDDPAARAENHRLVLASFGPGDELVDLRQVHGAVVHDADDSGSSGGGEGRPRADGLVTRRSGVTLMVRVADCVPVLLADPAAGLIGAAHSGRAGLVAGVVPATVARLRELGAGDLTAWVGPRVCGACYEVPAALQDEVAAAVPESRATTSWGTPSLDIGAGVRAQLEALDVAVVDVAVCTRESADLYSYRRDGAASGRFAGLIRRRP